MILGTRLLDDEGFADSLINDISFLSLFFLLDWFGQLFMPLMIFYHHPISQIFKNWLNGIDKKTKAKICIGVSAICWSVWNCRNDIVFNMRHSTKKLQVIHIVAHWI
jgi:hypothetical protein